MTAGATVIYVAYRTDAIDLSWLPDGAPVIIVHNDERLTASGYDHGDVQHIRPGTNLGFGRAVNLALAAARTPRVVLVNPDTQLAPQHWDALASAADDEVVSIPLLDGAGVGTSVLNRYPTPAGLVLGGWRVGRLTPLGSRRRRLLLPLLGPWGKQHVRSQLGGSRLPLSEHWLSGAVLSLPRSRTLEVGGFDASYFLYFEDVDLCQRLAARFPGMWAHVADVEPGRHAVGASSTGWRDRVVERHRIRSAVTYASRRRGLRWRVAAGALLPRLALLART